MICMFMQEHSRVLQYETARLSSERDAALAKLKETEENVFILQQTVEVHGEMLMILQAMHA